jgi:hypothetical protein
MVQSDAIWLELDVDVQLAEMSWVKAFANKRSLF